MPIFNLIISPVETDFVQRDKMAENSLCPERQVGCARCPERQDERQPMQSRDNLCPVRQDGLKQNRSNLCKIMSM